MAIKDGEETRRRKAVGREGEERAIALLKLLGFTNIRRPQVKNSVYDLEAIDPKGRPCLIEVKTRSPRAKTQTFVIRESKIRNLKIVAELKKAEEIYFLLLNKYGHYLITLDDLLKGGIPGVKIAKFKKWSARVVIPGIRHGKPEMLRIRCSRATRVRFKRLAAEFRDYEEALNAMMDLWERHRRGEIIIPKVPGAILK